MPGVIISSRFNGPADSANGGYAAGIVASHLGPGQPVTVTLRQPPPLDVPLEVRRVGDGVEVYAGDRLIAEAVPAPGDAAMPAVAPVSHEEAARASKNYPGFVEHPFPTCYVCGPDRPAGDGLGIFPGSVDGRMAALWRVAADQVNEVSVWAALDCPGGWTIAGPGRPYVLGRITAVLDALPRPGDECVVVGEPVAKEGRKARVRSTVYAPDGGIIGRAEAVWIAIEK